MAQQAIDEAGNIWETDAAGNPVRFVGREGGQESMTIGQPDPYKASAEQRATASAARAADMAAAQMAVMKAELALKEQAIAKGATGGNQGTKISPVTAKRAALEALTNQLAEVERQFKDNFAGPNDRGVEEYLPTPTNRQFDTASAGLSEQALGAFRTPGVGSQSDAELRAFVRANEPGASEYDEVNQQRIDNIRTRLIEQRKAMGMDETSSLQSTAPSQGQRQLATGGTRTEDDPDAAALIDRMIRGGASAEQINASLPPGASPVDPAAVAEAQQHMRANPGYKGSYGAATRTLPIDNPTLSKFVQTPLGTGAATYLNAASAGIPTLLGGDDANHALDAARELNPKSGFAGDVVGGVTGVLGAGKAMAPLAAVPGVTGRALSNPLTADMLYSAAFGANSSAEGDRLQGAALGTGAALGGNALGRTLVSPLMRAAEQPGAAVANRARGIFGRSPIPFQPAPKPSLAENAIVNAVGEGGQDVVSQLDEAGRLGLPMTLADASPELRSLAGAAVRRSPAVKGLAETTLGGRSRGQIDRLTGAMDRDFGAGANIPQRSADLIEQARTASKPLYDAYRAAPGASSVQIDDLAATPLGQQALQEARTGVLNRPGGDPTALGFDLNDAGEVVLGRVPSFETLDLWKRALDDLAEPARNPLTGKMMDPTPGQSAADNLRKELIRRVDGVNGDYAAARTAYSGPARERDTFQRGAASINLPPDVIGMQVGNMADPQLGQYRLGYRSALGDRAETVRFSSNPWEQVAGSPAGQERLTKVFPDNAQRFLGQYQLEGKMAHTNREILGNSMTAERQLADEAFGLSPGAALAVDGAMAFGTGAPPVATGLRLFGQYGKDAMKIGLGRKKADEIGPILLSPDASAAASSFKKAGEKVGKFKAAKKRAKRRGGIFGTSMALPVAMMANE